MIHLIVLVMVVFLKDGGAKVSILPLPAGTTLEDCWADHKPALDANVNSDVIKLGYTCVDVVVLPTSAA